MLSNLTRGAILLFAFFLTTATTKPLLAQQKSPANPPVANFYSVRSEMLEKMQEAEEIEESAGEEDGLYAKFKRWEYFMHQRTFPSGNFFRPDALINEFNRTKTQRTNSNGIQSIGWTALGPFTVPTPIDSNLSPGIGRANCIIEHPSDSNILFIGTACGGIWRSADGGQSWICSSDQLPSMSITDIAFNPVNPDTIYAATGDAAGNFAAQPNWNIYFPGGQYAAGILMSADGGLTWNQTGLTYAQAETAVMYKVIVNPAQTNVVLAATAKGIYRTDDGGTNWIQVDTLCTYDLMLNPLDPSMVYAMAGNKIKRSFDYGATWVSYPYSLGGVQSLSHFAISEADTNVIMLVRSSGAVFRSFSGGVTFTQLGSTQTFGHQSDYDKPIAMSPVNVNDIYLGLVPIIKSTDGGVNWNSISSFVNTHSNYIHPDFHGITISKFNPSKIYAANDGGVYVSNDEGATWTSLNNGISISQYYKLSSSYTQPDLILGGTQDNSTHRYDGTSWKIVTCCDGMDNATDFTDENVCYASIQGGNFSRSENAGLVFNISINPPGFYGSWVTPIAMNPLNSNNIYVGNDVVHSSYDKGASWQVISPNIGSSNLITILETAPQDSNVIVAASLGVIHRTSDKGANWTDIVTGLPVDSAAISDVAISDDALNMWASFSGYKDGLKLFKSNDGGTTWSNYSGTLPNIPVNCLEYQKGTSGDLYAGTDFGVFYRNDTMSDWVPFNTNLPYVMIGDLDINYGNGKIRAATYGRGMYEADPVTPVQFIQTDAGVVSILKPIIDSYCDSLVSPLIVSIRNYGTDTLTSVNINYTVDNGPVNTFLWTGNLPKLSVDTDTLGQITCYAGAHSIHVYTSDPNNGTDGFAGNNEKSITVQVDTVIAAFPVAEGFEAGIFPPQDWKLSGSASLWYPDSTVGGFGLSSRSMFANFFGVVSGTQNVVSSRIDLTTATAPAWLSFSHAYAMYNETYIDTLTISISSDCGASWTPLYSKWDSLLTTVPAFISSPFIPQPFEWTNDLIDISAFLGQEVMIRIEAHSGYGNQCYVDDINIFHSGVSIEEVQLNALSIFPNPSTGLCYLVDPSHIVKRYSVYNTEGRLIRQKGALNGDAIDLSTQADGLYFIKMDTESNSVVRKLNLFKR